MTQTVLFACVHNAGRSQMGAALFNRLADPARARAVSAGTRPAAHVHPEVVASLAEIGIDLGDVTPQKLTPSLIQCCDLLVTMGCDEDCPVVPGLERLDWPLADPKGRDPEEVRAIRQSIETRVALLLAERGWARLPCTP